VHEHNVLEGVLVEKLNEEGVFITSLLFQLDNMAVHVIDVLIVQLLVEFPLELSAVCLLL
jgi:hypothetical protein